MAGRWRFRLDDELSDGLLAEWLLVADSGSAFTVFASSTRRPLLVIGLEGLRCEPQADV